jgi:hypothetical protein
VFGVHPWHWYVSQGIAAVVGPAHLMLAVRMLFVRCTDTARSGFLCF